MKRLFLRSPFRFEPRITSRFSYRRVHPILGGVRPHLGVDYGAPTGTPVIAVATGTVVSAGRSGGSGNMVRLRHTNGYETYYLHLSAFGSGVRRGRRVFQGQEIGKVGSTGLSTGPHLDYRMRKNGVFVNPLLEHRNLPPGDPGARCASRGVRGGAGRGARPARVCTDHGAVGLRVRQLANRPPWPSSARSAHCARRRQPPRPSPPSPTTLCRPARRGGWPRTTRSVFSTCRARRSICRTAPTRTAGPSTSGRPAT